MLLHLKSQKLKKKKIMTSAKANGINVLFFAMVSRVFSAGVSGLLAA
jgi:hypothetical protein